MIIECSGCSRKYSSRAPSCPGCGEATPEEFADVPTGDAPAPAEASPAAASPAPPPPAPGEALPPPGGAPGEALPPPGAAPGAGLGDSPSGPPTGGIGQQRVVSSRSLLEKQKAAGALKPKSNTPKIVAAVVGVILAIFVVNGVKGFFTAEEAKIVIGNPNGAEPGVVDLAKFMMAPYGFVEKKIELHAHFQDVGSTQNGYTIVSTFAPATGYLDFVVADKYISEFSKLDEGDRFGAFGRISSVNNTLAFRVD